MQISCKWICHALAAVVLASAMVGCVRGEKQTAEQMAANYTGASTANFDMKEIKGDSVPSQTNATWNVNTARDYTFTVCFKFTATNAILRNQRFVAIAKRAQGDTVFPAKEPTNNDGCSSWTETVHYNPFADSQYIELKRLIQGETDNLRGNRVATLCVNPWAADRRLTSPEVYDCGFRPMPAGVRVAKQQDTEMALHGLSRERGGFQEGTPIYMDNIAVSTQMTSLSSENDGAPLTVRVEFQPGISPFRPDGTMDPNPLALPGGRFRITPVLRTYTELNGHLEYHERISSKPVVVDNVQMINGWASARFDFQIKATCSVGSWHLGLRVEAIDPPAHLKPFEGVFDLQTCQELNIAQKAIRILPEWRVDRRKPSLVYTASGALREPHHPDFTEWLQPDNTPLDEILKIDGRARQEPFNLRPLQVRWLGIEPGETNVQRTVLYQIQACPSHPGNNRHLAGVKFDVYRIVDGKEPEKLDEDNQPNRAPVTGGESCFIYRDRLTHWYYEKEHYFRVKYRVVRRLGNVYAERTVFINPWDFGFTFGRDTLGENATPAQWEAEERLAQSKPPSRMVIYGYRYETISFRYEIDPWLNLIVRKNIIFRIEPFVIRAHSLTQGRGNNREPIRDGIYLLRTAIQKIYDDHGREREFIDTYETPVRVQSGAIVAPIEYAMKDLRLMRVRSNMLMELIPLDEKQILVDSNGQFHGDYTRPIQPLPKERLESLILNPEETGLVPRTFVGPIIPLSNSFGSGTRPTDNLEENDCKSSGECFRVNEQETQYREALQRADTTQPNNQQPFQERVIQYEPYQNFLDLASNRLLKNISVTELIKRREHLDAHNRQEMDYYATYSKFAERSNSEYLQIGDQKTAAFRFRGGTMTNINHALPSCTQPEQCDLENQFLKTLNDYPFDRDDRERERRPMGLSTSARDDVAKWIWYGSKAGVLSRVDHNRVTHDDFEKLVQKGIMSSPLAARMCAFWFSELLPKSLGLTADQLYGFHRRDSSSANPAVVRALYDCMEGITADHQSVFNTQLHLKVDDFSDYVYRRGMSVNFSIKSDTRLGNTDDIKRSTQWNFNFPLVGELLRVIGVTANVGFNRGQTRAFSHSVSGDSAINLVIQMAKFNITLSHYVRCASVRVRPEFLEHMEFFQLVNNGLRRRSYVDFKMEAEASMGHELDEERAREMWRAANVVDTMDLATRGMLICEGEEVQRPLKLRETYHYVAQNFAEGDMNDPGNLRNHPWLIMIRGVADYVKFVNLMTNNINLTDSIQSIRRRFNSPDEGATGIILEHGDGPREQNLFGYSGFRPNNPHRGARVLQEADQIRGTRGQGVNGNSRYDHTYWVKLQEDANNRAALGRDPSRDPALFLYPPGMMNGINAPNINFEGARSNEGYRLWDSRPLQFESVPEMIRSTIFDARWKLMNVFETYNFPVERLTEIYNGTVPTFPGFITLTPDSKNID